MKDHFVKVSVITVCRNSQGTIERCVTSVLSQAYSNIEHVIVDGASSDGTLDVVRKLATPNIVTVSEPDHGIYDAMNKGIRLATGDIVCFLNSDDRYSDFDVISDVVAQFTGAELDLLLSNVGIISKKKPDRLVRKYSARNFSPSKLSYGLMPPHPGMFASKRLMDKVGLFKADYKIAADFDYVCRIFKINGVKYSHLDRTTVYMNAGGVSNSGFKSKITLNQEVLRAAKENSIKMGIFSLFIKYFYKIFELRR